MNKVYEPLSEYELRERAMFLLDRGYINDQTIDAVMNQLKILHKKNHEDMVNDN